MTWIDWALAGAAVMALGGWWDARKEAKGWKNAFCKLWNEMAEKAVKSSE